MIKIDFLHSPKDYRQMLDITNWNKQFSKPNKTKPYNSSKL